MNQGTLTLIIPDLNECAEILRQTIQQRLINLRIEAQKSTLSLYESLIFHKKLEILYLIICDVNISAPLKCANRLPKLGFRLVATPCDCIG